MAARALLTPLGRLGALLQTWRAVALVWHSAPFHLVASVLLTAANGVLPLIVLLLLKGLVDEVAVISGGTITFADVMFQVGLLSLATLAVGVGQTLAAVVEEAQSQALTAHVADMIQAKSVALDLEYYDQAPYYRMLHRAQREAAYRPVRIVRGLARLAQTTLTLACMTGVLLVALGPWLLLLLAAALPGVFVRFRFSRRLNQWQDQYAEDERRVWYYEHLLVGESSAKELRLFDLGSLFRERYRQLSRNLRQTRLAIIRGRGWAELAAQLPGALAVFAVLAISAKGVFDGHLSPGGFLIFFMALRQALGSFQEALGSIGSLYEDNLFLKSFHDFLALAPGVVDPPRPQPIPNPIRMGFAVDRVSFHYPGSDRFALQEVSLAIRPGQVVALVGRNGAGKSTLVKLLCRLYDPISGQVTLDGVPLPQFTLAELRRLISGVFQDPVHYSFPLDENVWLGDAAQPADQPRVDAALELAGAMSFIRQLPEGKQTLLGHWRKGGTELSGGEWQRLGLARGLYRPAALLILDEPTSSMDAEAEYQFFTALRRGLGNRSALLISHRFHTIRQADYIYVLEEGRMVEEGVHASLVEAGGVYARLHDLQQQLAAGSPTD